MSKDLGRLVIARKTGQEPFHSDGQALGFDLFSFWRWAASDLVSNATRGLLAEYIVAQSLGLATPDVREEWASFDLQTPSGIKIEVKSAAYVQSWHQKKLSSISFLVPKTRGWDSVTNIMSTERRRQADVYVFALLAHADKTTIDPLDITQWLFYVLPTSTLDARTRSQHSITLKSLERLCGGPTHYAELRAAIEIAAGRDLGCRTSGGDQNTVIGMKTEVSS